VIEADGIRYSDLTPLIPKALEALAIIKPGDIVLIR